MGLQYLEESRGTAILTLLSFSTPKLDAWKIILTHNVCQRFAVHCGFSSAQGSGPIPFHLENTSKVIRPKKQDSQVGAPAGFSDVIDTTHREAHIN